MHRPKVISAAQAQSPHEAFRWAVLQKCALAGGAGTVAGLVTCGLLAWWRFEIFAMLRQFGPLHTFLISKSVPYVRTFAEIINDSLAFMLLGASLLPAIIWAATLERGRWLKNPWRLVTIAQFGAICGGVGMFCIEVFLINPPGLKAHQMSRGLAIMLTWLFIGPCFGALASLGLKRVPLVQGLFGGLAGGVITGVVWMLLYLFKADPNSALRFPMAGLIFGISVIAARALFTVAEANRSRGPKR